MPFSPSTVTGWPSVMSFVASSTLSTQGMPYSRAHELGLVNQVVPLSGLDEAVDAWVSDILRCAPLAVQATKQSALRGLEMPLSEAAATTFEAEIRRRSSLDAEEGPRAFAEKRQPIWRGE